MIVHSITVVKAQQSFPKHEFKSLKVYGKWAYAQFIKGIPFKKGDYLVPKGTIWPYPQAKHVRVIGIAEIHYMVKEDSQTGEPLAVEVIDYEGDRYYIPPSAWTRAIIHPAIELKLPEE